MANDIEQFDEWFYSENHRKKYLRDGPVYLGAMEAWEAARAHPEQPSAGVPEGLAGYLEGKVKEHSGLRKQAHYGRKNQMLAHFHEGAMKMAEQLRCDLPRLFPSQLTAAPTAQAVQGGGVNGGSVRDAFAARILYEEHAKQKECGVTGCKNQATHTWSGHPTCDECGSPGRVSGKPATHPHNGEQGGEWLSFDERLPAEADYMVWYWDDFQGLMIVDWKAALMRGQRSPAHNPHWMPTGLKRPAPPTEREGESHEWDDSGERCIKCGDKDWFAGSSCKGGLTHPQPPKSKEGE